MRARRSALISTWVALAAAGLTAGPARAARAQTGEEPDDPKLARRLGPRAPLAPPAAVERRSPGPPDAVKLRPPAAASPPVAAVPPPPANDAAAGWWSHAVTTGDTSSAGLGVYAAPPPPAAAPAAPRPRLKLAYRRFDFVRVGASGSSAGTVAGEPFDSVSVDVYPLSSLVRIGLSSQYGWQSGAGLSGGDYFAAESLSAGAQLRGGRVVPFGEAFGGIGYMRRLQFERTIPTAYWQLGVDAGAEIFFADNGFVSVALGYLHPVNGFAMQQKFVSVFVDTWSFKLGVGF
jgi:hypothetical protein